VIFFYNFGPVLFDVVDTSHLEFNRQIEHSKCSCVAIVAAGRVFLGAAFVLEFYVRSGADK